MTQQEKQINYMGPFIYGHENETYNSVIGV